MSAENSDFDDDFASGDMQRIWAEVQPIVRRRALIEQTKGMLMFVYGVDADAAFEILRSQSQQHNIKLRLIAEQIKNDLLELAEAHGGLGQQRMSTDRLVLAAHQRIADVAARQMDGANKTSE